MIKQLLTFGFTIFTLIIHSQSIESNLEWYSQQVLTDARSTFIQQDESGLVVVHHSDKFYNIKKLDENYNTLDSINLSVKTLKFNEPSKLIYSSSVSVNDYYYLFKVVYSKTRNIHDLLYWRVDLRTMEFDLKPVKIAEYAKLDPGIVKTPHIATSPNGKLLFVGYHYLNPKKDQSKKHHFTFKGKVMTNGGELVWEKELDFEEGKRFFEERFNEIQLSNSGNLLIKQHRPSNFYFASRETNGFVKTNLLEKLSEGITNFVQANRLIVLNNNSLSNSTFAISFSNTREELNTSGYCVFEIDDQGEITINNQFNVPEKITHYKTGVKSKNEIDDFRSIGKGAANLHRWSSAAFEQTENGLVLITTYAMHVYELNMAFQMKPIPVESKFGDIVTYLLDENGNLENTYLIPKNFQSSCNYQHCGRLYYNNSWGFSYNLSNESLDLYYWNNSRNEPLFDKIPTSGVLYDLPAKEEFTSFYKTSLSLDNYESKTEKISSYKRGGFYIVGGESIQVEGGLLFNAINPTPGSVNYHRYVMLPNN